jgi:hypothetical protein
MNETADSAAKEPPAEAGGSFVLRRWLFAAFVAAVLLVVVMTRPAGEPRLPDLGFAPPDELYVSRTEHGELKLRLSSMIVNVGDGPLLIEAEYDRGRDTWEISQMLARSVRGVDRLDVVAEVRYGGDGHDHLHIENAARYTLTRIGDDTVLAADEKVGFCFFDQNPFRTDLEAAPPSPVFMSAECGGAAAVAFNMGLSVGYGDNYIWSLPGQSLPIDGLPDGEYLLTVTADPDGMFRETDDTNNSAWALIRFVGLTGPEPTVEVLDRGSDV